VPTNEEKFIKDFGSRLADLRKKHSFSQEKLAWEAGIGDNQVGRIERGEISVSLKTIYKICKALKIDAKDLF
jgi:transcriptional regulator with XRE-family HTH domain